MDRAKIIFGNEIAAGAYRKACRQKEKFLKKYGDDSGKNYYFKAVDNPVLAPLGVKTLTLTDEPGLQLPDNAVIVGNIRMGYGHYRISMAIASAAHALGYEPYWLDLKTSTPSRRPPAPGSSPGRTSCTPSAPDSASSSGCSTNSCGSRSIPKASAS